MSILNLRSGYYQEPSREEDRDETTWTTPFGIYRFKVMPLGLRNAGATFQRLADRIRTILFFLLLLVYIDDFVLLSKAFKAHLAEMRQAFEQFRKFGLRINWDKCNFC